MKYVKDEEDNVLTQEKDKMIGESRISTINLMKNMTSHWNLTWSTL